MSNILIIKHGSLGDLIQANGAIKDIKNLQKGEEINVLLLDRNCCDRIDTFENQYGAKRPSQFFDSTCMAKYTHGENLKGKLHHNVCNWTDDDFEFHIMYKEGYWYPLQNGCLPAFSADDDEPLLDGVEKPWYTFPDDTYIGWRGPMIVQEYIDELPDVYLRLESEKN